MSGFIDFAGQMDTAAQWLLCGWSDRAAVKGWQDSAATITLRGARARIPASICSFHRTDIDSGAGLLVRFESNVPVDAWTRLGRVELACDGERLKLTRASGASVLPNAELKRRLRDVLPHAVAGALRQHLLHFAFNGHAPMPCEAEDAAFIAQLIERRSLLLNRRWLEGRYGIPPVVLEDDRLAATVLHALADDTSFTPTPLFHPEWYRRQVGEQLPPRGSFALLRHYLEVGEQCGFSPNAFFPIGRYASTCPPPPRGMSYLEQFLGDGPSVQQAHHLLFDWRHYDLGNTLEEAAADAAGLDRFAHYVAYGHKEARNPNPLFDEDWYLNNHADVARLVENGVFPNGFAHFVHEGERLGLAPNAFFNPADYLRLNEDVGRAVAAGSCRSAFWHYWTNGRTECRATAGDPILGNVLLHFGTRMPWSDPLAMRAIQDCAILHGTSQSRQLVVAALRHADCPLIEVREFEPPVIYVGESGTIHIGGQALLPFAPLTAITAQFAGRSIAGEFFRFPRADAVPRMLFPAICGHSLDTGFFVTFCLDSGALAAGLHPLRLTLSFSDGNRTQEFAGPDLAVRIVAPDHRSALKAPLQVCMATYRARSDQFQRQVESILHQWPAAPDIIIADDATPFDDRSAIAGFRPDVAKIAFYGSEINRGFVANFERALRLVSPAAERVLLSDQDDVWEPCKVEALREAIDQSGNVCAFSDMSVVDDDLQVISPTFWSGRKVHYRSPVALAVANAVTGAAAMLRADFAERLVPFPRFIGIFHDQWLSVAAAACGHIGYVDKPLYSYVQHDGNALGFVKTRQSNALYWRIVARALCGLRHRAVTAWDDRDCDLFLVAMRQCHGNLMQRYVLLREALARFQVWSDLPEQQFAQDLCDAIADRRSVGLPGLVRTWRRMRRQVGGDAALLGIDYALKAGLSVLLMTRMLGGALGERLARRIAAQTVSIRRFKAREAEQQSTPLERKIAPVPIVALNYGDLRINLLVPEIRQDVFFGGYYTKFALLRRLRECGVDTRVLLLDQPEVEQDQMLRIANDHPALAESLVDTEVIAVGARSETIPFGRGDVVLATTWWSAHVAEDIRRRLGHRRFLYLIQEFEPFTFPLGTWYRSAEMTYGFPHVPLFSTNILRDYFRSVRQGIFAVGRGSEDHLVFDNPIVAEPALSGEPRMRENLLVFYARRQLHAARNMYDFGVAALRLVVQRLGEQASDWQFVGLGSDQPGSLELAPGVSLSLRAKTSHAEYLHTLHQAKVGLALIYTPHPSLVPLEMAAAGLRTVTNSCMTKDAMSFRCISPNIAVAEPDAASIADTLLAAMRATRRATWRPKCGMDWPTTPAQAFPDPWLARLVKLARASVRSER